MRFMTRSIRFSMIARAIARADESLMQLSDA